MFVLHVCKSGIVLFVSCLAGQYSVFCFFFFKQKTAYEMRTSDWSSDVCSSDLPLLPPKVAEGVLEAVSEALYSNHWLKISYRNAEGWQKIGRASCRERVCQYV